MATPRETEPDLGFFLRLGPGLVGGYFYSVCRSYYMGVLNTPSGSGLGAVLDGGLEALRSKVGRGGGLHVEAGTFAVCWATYRTVEVNLARYRGKEDCWNSIIGLGAAGGLGLGILQIRQSPRAASFVVGSALSASVVGVCGWDLYKLFNNNKEKAIA